MIRFDLESFMSILDVEAYDFAMQQAADLAAGQIFGVWFENVSYDDLTNFA